MPPVRTQAAANARKAQSCIECRRRKKPCEGEIPGCVSCVKRGTVANCRFGDHRDAEYNAAAATLMQKSYPTPSATVTNGAAQYHASDEAMMVNGYVGDAMTNGVDTIEHSLGSPSPASLWPTRDSNEQRTKSLSPLLSPQQQSPPLLSQSIGTESVAGSLHSVAQQQINNDRPNDRPMQSMPTWRTRLSSNRDQLPQRWQADRLIDMHRTYLGLGGATLLPDAHLVRVAYPIDNPSDDDLPDVWSTDGSILALLLMICASSLNVMPLSLTFSIIRTENMSKEEKDDIADLWTEFAVDFYEHGDFYRRPQLETVAGLVLYELNLVSSTSQVSMIHRLDAGIRVSRILGLDRLGSADEDQRRWDAIDAAAAAAAAAHRTQATELPSAATPQQQQSDARPELQQTLSTELLSDVPMSATAAGDWAARTYARRDHVSREIGRSLWYLLVARDWNAGPQAGGTFSIYPGTFTTRQPKMLLQRAWRHAEHGCTHDDRSTDAAETEYADVWYFIFQAADCFRQYHQLYAESASRNEEVRYEDVLALDMRITKLLDERPAWLQTEASTDQWRFGFDTALPEPHCVKHIHMLVPYVPQYRSSIVLCYSAIFIISSTLWHKLFIIVGIARDGPFCHQRVD